MKKSLVLLSMISSALALPASASNLVLTVGSTASLPECQGYVQVTQSGRNVFNLVFQGVKQCSNFDIVSKRGGYLDLNYRARKLPVQGSTRGGSFTIPQAFIDYGFNDIEVVVKSDSGKHEDKIDLVVVASVEPARPRPPVVISPYYPSGYAKDPSLPSIPVRPAPLAVSLAGFCEDSAHTNFYSAKQFAYSGTGLNLGESAAVEWALDYNNRHACGTIQEYQARFAALYDYAYSGSYLNLASAAAKSYATARVESTPAYVATGWKATFTTAKDLFYSGSYLNLSSSAASAKADEWVQRGCGGESLIRQIEQTYAGDYAFAYSGSGLNLSAAGARAYALGKVKYLTACSDLF